MITVSMLRMFCGEFISQMSVTRLSPFCPFGNFLNMIIWQGKRLSILLSSLEKQDHPICLNEPNF